MAEGRGKRGLLNHRTSVDAFGEVLEQDVVGRSRSTACSTSASCAARYDVALEQYNKTINIEGQLMVLMANRYILPAAFATRAIWPRASRR